MVGIDPDGVVVIAARRAFDGVKCVAAVGGAVSRRVADVDGIGVTRIGANPGEIVAASPYALLVVGAAPVQASIVTPVDARFRGNGIDHGIETIAVGRGDGDADAAKVIGGGGQSLGEWFPRGAAVDGFEQAAIGALKGIGYLPGRLAGRPQDAVNDIGTARIECEIHAAGVLVLAEHFLESGAAVGGAVNAALGVRAVGVAEPTATNRRLGSRGSIKMRGI